MRRCSHGLKFFNQQGFTFLEMMIAISILATIALFTTRMIESGMSSRRKVQGLIDRTSGVRDVLGLMQRDIALAFNYHDLNTEMFNAAQTIRRKNAQTQQNGNQPPNPPAGSNPTNPSAQLPDESVDPAIAERYPFRENKVFTAFAGESDKLDFSSLNNFRSSRESRESSQCEIGYFTQSCTNPKTKKSSTCLYRRTTPYIDENIKEGGQKKVLLYNVKSLKFRYLGPGETEDVWRNSWSSQAKDSSEAGTFPLAVEINLTVEDAASEGSDQAKKEVALTVVSPIQFPNNREETPNGP